VITSAIVVNEIPHFAKQQMAFYYPAQQPDPEGNVTTVFGFSSPNNYASVVYASRRAAQTRGTLPDNGLIAKDGLGPYVTADPQRWGDYFATAPAGIVSGGGTGGFPKMWFAAPYASSTSSEWNTAIGRTGYSNIGPGLAQQASMMSPGTPERGRVFFLSVADIAPLTALPTGGCLTAMGHGETNSIRAFLVCTTSGRTLRRRG
jgi:hypothetical protein